mmetsp:Transcript_25790/g.26234  ORF Transcript_25790/g.26234 Transcript_25790/m.26234 type:complete len:114 (-) Transcript_25790:1614-1955(-)
MRASVSSQYPGFVFPASQLRTLNAVRFRTGGTTVACQFSSRISGPVKLKRKSRLDAAWILGLSTIVPFAIRVGKVLESWHHLAKMTENSISVFAVSETFQTWRSYISSAVLLA